LIKIISKKHEKNLQIEKEKLKNEKLRELENERTKSNTEKLERELTHKRKLLANSALTIAQKNKMLNNIKSFVQNNSLTDIKARQNKQKLLHLIEMNLNSDHEWEIFEQNFAEVHDDFLDNLKGSHPDLTSGDLRLAAYIKMGLSSKEISPLLNISVRSVENKRYRLRKKMNLSGEDNLSDQLMRY
jgi:DNA-binding CsgD family transcriptional regulator